MAALVLPVVGGDDHLIALVTPALQERGKHRVHHVAGVIHLFAVVIETVAHAVQGAGVQDAVIDAMHLTQPGERGEKIDIRRRHLVDVAIARHGVEPAMGDGAARLIIFDVAHNIERRAVEEFGPKAVRHRPGFQPGLGGFGKHIRLLKSVNRLIAPDPVDLRRHPGVDRGIARGRGRRQHRTDAVHRGIAIRNPAFEIAKEPPPVAVGHAV